MSGYDMDVQYVKGVGEKRAALLKKLGIETLYDAVHYYPRAYLDLSSQTAIADLTPGETVCVKAVVGVPVHGAQIRRGMTIFKTIVTDGEDTLHITIFNSAFTARRLEVGETFLFYGKVAYVNGCFEMTNPLIETEDAAEPFRPVYPLTAGLSTKQLGAIIRNAIPLWEQATTDDLIPGDVRRTYQLCHERFAIQNIHFPNSPNDAGIARRRLMFEELFVLQCGMAQLRHTSRVKTDIRIRGDALPAFLALLPFELTGAQRRAVDDCVRDLSGGVAMNRLVQGDVGSGKTMVAAAALFLAAKSGVQSALMAPTELLAKQHYETLTRLFGDTVRVVLLTGGLTAKEKKQTRAAIAAGDVDVAVGTHALLSEDVAFHRLGLVVTDEQHRFGVRQRGTLSQKGDAPHVLVMSATPIPRTLSLIIFGDLDLSVIDELPGGRQPIRTDVVDSSYHARIWAFLRKHLDAGRQAYVVCPALEEGEGELLSAAELAQQLSDGPFAGYRVGLLHGKMKPREKAAVMTAFAAGEVQLLVATTVVEVGIDVPNAVIMVVENAERFGLSQLHQLRGRVGRGSERSYCILVSDADSDTARQRLSVMKETTDGFKIADADLRLRGPGDFFGARQHGLPQMKIADLMQDMTVLREAQQAAAEIIAQDPGLSQPEHSVLNDAVRRLFARTSAQALN